MRSYELVIPASPQRIRRAMDEAIELGQAAWGQGARDKRLLVPVHAGIRTGSMEVDWSAEETGAGTRIRLEVRDERLRANPTALAILLIGAVGGLMTIVWPLHPALLRLAPLGALLALLAWFLVVSRLRSRGPEDFLETLASLATEEESVGE